VPAGAPSGARKPDTREKIRIRRRDGAEIQRLHAWISVDIHAWLTDWAKANRFELGEAAELAVSAFREAQPKTKGRKR